MCECGLDALLSPMTDACDNLLLYYVLLYTSVIHNSTLYLCLMCIYANLILNAI